MVVAKGETSLLLEVQLASRRSRELLRNLCQQFVQIDTKTWLLATERTKMVLSTGIQPAENDRWGAAEGSEVLVHDGRVYFPERGVLDLIEDSEELATHIGRMMVVGIEGFGHVD